MSIKNQKKKKVKYNLNYHRILGNKQNQKENKKIYNKKMKCNK